MALETIPKTGLKAPESVYVRLKAFHGGGFYWDSEVQQLIRSSLQQFLPSVEQCMENGQRSGLFHCSERNRELLSKSVSVGTYQRVPAKQLELLERQLSTFKQKADLPEVTPNNREIIRQFKLPDFSKNPELYRLTGPFWNRRLHVLWGCERTPDSSLLPSAALKTLPADNWYEMKRWGLWSLLLLLLLVLLCFLIPRVKRGLAIIENKQPVAILKLEQINETNRFAVISDNGSHDPDGTIKQWDIYWGDSSQASYQSAPINLDHAYLKDGDYTIRLICTDDLDARSSPSEIPIHFDYESKLKAAVESELANRKRAELEAQKTADELAAKQAETDAEQASRKQAELDAKKAADELAVKQADADAERLSRKMAELDAQRLADQLARTNAEERAKQLADAIADKKPISDASQSPLVNRVHNNTADRTKAAPDMLKAAQSKLANPTAASNPNSLNPTKPKFAFSESLYIDIQKVSSRLLADGMMEVTLTARDSSGQTLSPLIETWQIDGTNYPGGMDFVGDLSKGGHKAGVQLKSTNGIPVEAKADVLVEVEESKEGKVTVNNSR